ncbi:MAG: DUF1203 domain-containing protein [Nitrospirota bacterium]
MAVFPSASPEQASCRIIVSSSRRRVTAVLDAAKDGHKYETGFPCRVSLVNAEPGEAVLPVPFRDRDVTSPYRAFGPIFLWTNARTASLEVNETPAMVRSRLLFVRGYGSAAMMTGANVVLGNELQNGISQPGYSRRQLICGLMLAVAPDRCATRARRG